MLGNPMGCQAGQEGSSSGSWRRRRRRLGGSCGAPRANTACDCCGRAVLLLRWDGWGASWEVPQLRVRVGWLATAIRAQV